MNTLCHLLCVCVCMFLSPHFHPEPPLFSVQSSVSSSVLLIKTVVCSSTWVACLYSLSCSLPQLFGWRFLRNTLSSHALRFWNRPAVPFDVGWVSGGFIQVWRPVLPLLSLWCCVHPQPGAGAPSESPVFRPWRWIEGLLMELDCGALWFLPSYTQKQRYTADQGVYLLQRRGVD